MVSVLEEPTSGTLTFVFFFNDPATTDIYTLSLHDALPIFGPGVVLDMSAKEEGETVDIADVETELDRIGHDLREHDIVLVRTGRDAFVEEPGYMALGPGVTVDTTRWLYERGVRVMGIDAWGWDGPLHLQAQAALETN